MTRYFYKVIGVSVERLQDINEEDCLKERITIQDIPTGGDDYSYCAYYGEPDFEEHSNIFHETIYGESPERLAFKQLWNSTTKKV